MPQITIGGDVNLIGWEGKRISVWENIHSNGKDYSRLWTCWFDTPQIQLQELDFVEISGELSTKIGKYTPKGQTEEKIVVEHHIQGAFIKSQVSKKQQAENLAQFDEMPF
jgi:hypothetical protein